ncbi:MAG: alpha-L-rhamnosidase [Acidobacteriota bacterium]|nr:alpha-L-rhamnosidase [Acidobacteriota bacterium]
MALDPSRNDSVATPVRMLHRPLPEQYIWTAGDAAVQQQPTRLSELKRNDWKVEPHSFRAHFAVARVPQSATLYLAGPRMALVYVNGVLAAQVHCEGGHHMGFQVMKVAVAPLLRSGQNVLAIQAVRGYGSHHHTNSRLTSWLNSGEVLVAKIVAEDGAPAVLLRSDAAWRSVAEAPAGWQRDDLDDSAWPRVTSLGSIEGSSDFFQWNADAGMWAWPGYWGESPYLANRVLRAVGMERQQDGSVLLDFGREMSGRALLHAAAQPLDVTVQYGESKGEAIAAPYLGNTTLHAAAQGVARGPKSAFRYLLVRAQDAALADHLGAEEIYYPVHYSGWFTSSNARLNRIWETAAYTAHLSLQDSLWDGVKRDRGRWIGDQEVIQRSVLDLFGNVPLVRSGLEDAAGTGPIVEHINGLPGYSAWWLVAEAEYLRRTGDLGQVRAQREHVLQVLRLMHRELDEAHLYQAATGAKPFVDWAEGFDRDTPEARAATQFEYLLGFQDAAWVLQQLGESAEAEHWQQQAALLRQAARQSLLRQGMFGNRLQTNAIAVLAGAATEAEQQSVWSGVLSRTGPAANVPQPITPYYADYVLEAMARTGHRREAVAWMRSYWGSMLDSGATSFWEAWDPAWAGTDAHARIDADNHIGYNASLAHGWSSGPASWLLEQVLGVTAAETGYRTVQIRPDAAGLRWVRGSVSTPLGVVRVSLAGGRLLVQAPRAMRIQLLLPAGSRDQHGLAVQGEVAEHGARLRVLLPQGGRYAFALGGEKP